MPTPPTRPSRRDFFRTAAAGGAILTLPAATYRAAFAADAPPSERIRLGFIGVGGQGKGNLNGFLGQKSALVTAVCDVDKTRLAAAADIVEKKTAKAPLTEGDFRKLLDSKDVDAVVVTTPDHWHAIPTILACQAGKDVYCEKPLTLFIAEGQAMVAAARKHNRVVQTGSQQRSDKEFRIACELVRNGAIGKVHTVKVGLPGPNWEQRVKDNKDFPNPTAKAMPDSAAPAELDYDLWLGPAPQRPYNANRVHYLFRFYWDYSGGQQTNWGAHHLDIAQWGLGMDDSGPVGIEGKADFDEQKRFETPTRADLTYTYANGAKILCSLGSKGFRGGTTFEGDKGTIFVTRGKFEANPAEVEKFTGGDVKLYVSKGHQADFLECIKTRKQPVADVAIGHRSASVCHLGNIALRTGRKITWDPVKEEIAGDSDAAKMVSREYRKPWTLG